MVECLLMVLFKPGFVYGCRVQNQVLSVKQGHSLWCALRRGVSGFVCMLYVKRGMGSPESLACNAIWKPPPMFTYIHTCTMLQAEVSEFISSTAYKEG